MRVTAVVSKGDRVKSAARGGRNAGGGSDAIFSWRANNDGGSRGRSGWRWARVIPIPTGFPVFTGISVRMGEEGRTMAGLVKSRGDPPRVIIFSESGPLAGDLSAILAGRFDVERVTSLQGAVAALERPSTALLFVPGHRDGVRPECFPLFRQAVENGCRVLLLGCVRPGLEEDLQGRVEVMPHFPSPEELFQGLRGASGTALAGEG